jgi:hypothetical protein
MKKKHCFFIPVMREWHLRHVEALFLLCLFIIFKRIAH